jgi:prepilin-type processing-associated H-X9-DG protein
VLAYVVNTGLPITDPIIAAFDDSSYDNPTGYPTGVNDALAVAAGVFHNLCWSPNRTVSLDYVSTHDGSTNTLMLSENVQATEWANPSNVLLAPWQAEVGMVWWRNYVNTSFTPTSFMPTTNPGPYNVIGINAHRDDVGTIPPGDVAPTYTPSYPERVKNGWLSTLPSGAVDRTDFLAYGRPSSRHPGGVLMTFCDGHTQFIADTQDYGVYQHIMTPSGKRLGLGVFDASQISNQ